MPARHSKQISDRSAFTHAERAKSDVGTLTTRLGVESQLPFGYCGLSLGPAIEPVVSPSGRIYSREAIIEYLLQKTKEIKELTREVEREKAEKESAEISKAYKQETAALEKFANTQGVEGVVKRKADEVFAESAYMNSRKKIIDDTSKETRLVELQRVSPWIPQNTPSALPTSVKEPPKRPQSPFSGEPLRAKDLIPIDLVRETIDGASNSGPVRFICPVSRKTITNQKVVLIKTSGCYLLENTAESLAYPTMICPLSGKKFKASDVLVLQSAASGFAASGPVEASKYRKSIT